MKYIYYILALLAALSAAIGYEFFHSAQPLPKAAIIINDKSVSMDEFDRLYRPLAERGQGREDFINTLITKELLIQESRRLGIDGEEPFRQSIQNFYEQSLIKLLLDRKLSTLAITVEDDDMRRYRDLSGRRFNLTVFGFATERDAVDGPYQHGEATQGCFEDLSKDVRDAVANLSEGRLSPPLRTGGRFIVVRLDRAYEAPSCRQPGADDEKLRRAILEDKKERMISEWIAGLRKKASIEILVD